MIVRIPSLLSGNKRVNLFAGMFRSKASFADPLSPVMVSAPRLKPYFCFMEGLRHTLAGEGSGEEDVYSEMRYCVLCGKYEAPRLQGGASRKGSFIYIVPLDPA